jgi:hypothetical protein
MRIMNRVYSLALISLLGIAVSGCNMTSGQRAKIGAYVATHPNAEREYIRDYDPSYRPGGYNNAGPNTPQYRGISKADIRDHDPSYRPGGENSAGPNKPQYRGVSKPDVRDNNPSARPGGENNPNYRG